MDIIDSAKIEFIHFIADDFYNVSSSSHPEMTFGHFVF